MSDEKKKMYAKDYKYIVCGKQAEVFWPAIDPDIPTHPYCKKCVAKEQIKLLAELDKIDKKYKKKKNQNGRKNKSDNLESS